MKSFMTTCFLVTVLLGCSSNTKRINEKKADIFYSKGTNDLMSQKYTNALIHLKKANQYRPDDTKILNNLGMAYYLKKENHLAKKYLLEALDVDEKNMDAKSNLAGIYLEEGRLQKSEKLFVEISKVLTYTNQYRVYYNLAIIAEKKYDQQKAIAYLKKSISEANDYCPAHLKLGRIYRSQGYLDQAAKSFHQASMGRCYEYAAPHFEQGITYYKMGNYQNARKKLIHVIKNFPNTSFAQNARKTLDKMSPAAILDKNKDFFDLPQSATIKNFKYQNKQKQKNNFVSPRF